MTGPEDIENRVRRLEQKVAQLRQELTISSGDASAARVLASGADRDVSEVRAELRAHTAVLNALRESQRELTEGQRVLTEGQRVLTEGQRRLEQGHLELRETVLDQGLRIDALQAEMRTGFAVVNTGVAQIVTLLGGPSPG